MNNMDVFDGLAIASGGLCLCMAWAYLQAARRTAQPGTGLLAASMLFAALTWTLSATVGSFVYRGNLLEHAIVLIPAIAATASVAIGFLQYVSAGRWNWPRMLAFTVGLMSLGQLWRMTGGPAWSVDAVVSLMLSALGVYCFFRHARQPTAGYLLIGGAFFIQPVTFLAAMGWGADLDHMRQLLGVPFALVGMIVFMIGFLRSHDVLAAHLAEISDKRQRLHAMVYQDEVTGLPSAHAQRKRMQELMANGQAFSLMLINLDDFRMINNNLGPAGGNAIIARTAQVMQEAIQGEGVLGRSGGAEFSLIIPHQLEADPLRALGRRIQARMEAPIYFENAIVYVPLSIGMARYPLDATDSEQLQRVAHVAVHEVKQRGGHDICGYESYMDDGLQEQVWLDRNLREALDRQQLSLHYQPKLLLHNGRATSVEALLRWTHPQRGGIRPDQFIPRAEATGLIIPIGRWVLDVAARQAAHWAHQGYALRVAVNVSAKQLVDPELMTHLRAAQSVAGGLLDIELTESSMLVNEKDSMQFIEQCRAMGYGVHLDDFGTGYSSLSRLGNLPLTLIKLDRAFVTPIGKSEKANALLKAMLSIGKELGIKVVAEGVETQAQADYLRALGVDYAQGWLYARAMPRDECDEWLAANRAQSSPLDGPALHSIRLG